MSQDVDLEPSILEVLKKYHLPSDETRVRQGALFIQLLAKWNKVYNFTSVKEPLDMVSRHWQDSLCIAPYIQGVRVLDVGTGPGLPGIPLSIVFKEKTFCLLDSNQRRQIFLEQVLFQLGLKHVNLHCGRVEDFTPELPFDCIVTRAFKPLAVMVKLCQHLLSDDGVFVAMKGEVSDLELKELDHGVRVVDIISLPNSHSLKPRHAVIIKASKQAS